MGKKRFKEIELKMAFSEIVTCTYYYKFICESCGHETKWFPVELTGKGSISKKDFNTLNPKEQKKLTQQAKQNLEINLGLIKEEVSRGDYEVYNDKCPNCYRKQSWSLKNRGWEVIMWGVVFFILWWFAISAPIFINFIPTNIYDVMTNFGLLFAFFAGITVGFFHRSNRKKMFIRSLDNHELEFNWTLE